MPPNLIACRCDECGATFLRRPDKITPGRPMFCSRRCSHAHLRTSIERACETCGSLFKAKPCLVAAGQARFCSRACAPNGAPRRPAWDRVLEKTLIGDGCWEFRGRLNPNGYAQISVGGHKSRHIYIHRLAWAIFNGAIPPGLHVLHRCDNRRCLRPDHLFLGTDADNAADMAQKGRSTRGERHPGAKLTEADVRAIRERYAEGSTQEQIAAAYDVTFQTVSRIVLRQRWKHVD